MVSDTYLPLSSDSSNPWTTLFKSIHDQYAPNLPFDGNVVYGEAVGYTFVQALLAAGQNPSRADIVNAINNSHFSGPGLVPFGYSSSNHLGYTGVQMVTVGPGPKATLVRLRLHHRRQRRRCHHHLQRNAIDPTQQRDSQPLRQEPGPRASAAAPVIPSGRVGRRLAAGGHR